MSDLFDDKLISYLKEHVRNYEGLPYWSLAMGIRGVIDEAREEWQPIETAPKDGTSILAWHTVWKCPVSVYWREKPKVYPVECKWLESTLTTAWPERAFTHWMPLPAPPKP